MKSIWRAVACGAFVLGCGAVQAADGNLPWEKGSLSIGGFITNSTTELQINSKALGAGAVVDLENALGVSADKTTWRLDGFWRFGSTRRHQIDVHYYDSRRSGSKVLDQDIQIGDEAFPINAAVDTEFDLRFLNVDYSYAFLQDSRVRLSGAIGLHTTGVELKMQEVGGAARVEEESFTAPLPVVGLRGDVVLTEKWRLKGGLDLLYLSYSGYTGVLSDALLAVEWLPFKHVGFGAGLNAVNIKVESDGDNDYGLDLNGEVKLSFTGAMLYIKAFY
jgi:hypothetical protein